MTCTGDLRGIGGFQEVVMANLPRSGGLQVTVSTVTELTHPPMGLEPMTYTSEALVAQYLHRSQRILGN
jgi:hypothetical protein